MGTIIAHYENTEYGIESFVVTGNESFNVCLKDTDANEFIGIVIKFKDKIHAINKAKEIVE